jgi:hypothetical protein
VVTFVGDCGLMSDEGRGQHVFALWCVFALSLHNKNQKKIKHSWK